MNKILIKNAHLISMDDNIGDPLDTDILIDNGTIERVEPSISAEAEIIDAKNYLIAQVLLMDTFIHGKRV